MEAGNFARFKVSCSSYSARGFSRFINFFNTLYDERGIIKRPVIAYFLFKPQ
jgi:hypothetical protein